MSKICAKCNTKNKNTAKFCENCGTKLEQLKQTSTKKPRKGLISWWNQRDTVGKGATVFVACILGILLLISFSGTYLSDKTTDSYTPTSPNTSSNTESASTTTQFQPITLSGSGEKATENFNWPGGLMRVTMSHKGDSNFAIWLMDADSGTREELIVNEIGYYSGSRAFSVPSGTYMLDVKADGPWSVQITK